MNVRETTLLGAVISLAISSHIAVAQEKEVERKIPQHSKEWTDHNSSDPGVASVAEDLQKIVVLCATSHQSPEFKRVWSAYLKEHKPDRAETAKLIKRVLAEAEQHRQEFVQVKQDRKRSANWKGEANKIMHDTSRSIIQNMKG